MDWRHQPLDQPPAIIVTEISYKVFNYRAGEFTYTIFIVLLHAIIAAGLKKIIYI